MAFLLALVPLLLASLSSHGAEARQPAQSQLPALFALHRSLRMSEADWLQPLTCARTAKRADGSTWSGIVCDDSGMVTELHLANKSLTGEFDRTAIRALPQLTRIDVASNCFKARLTDFVKPLSALLKLNHLDLSENYLYGALPDSLGALKTLNLRACYLTGSIPSAIRRSATLRAIDVAGNHLATSLSRAALPAATFTGCAFDPAKGTFCGGLGECVPDVAVSRHECFKRPAPAAMVCACTAPAVFNPTTGSCSKWVPINAAAVAPLLAVKAAMGASLPNWATPSNTSWSLSSLSSSSPSLCRLSPDGSSPHWKGVTCDVDGNPIALDLPAAVSSDGAGYLPHDIADVSTLTHIDLSGNQLSGSIPSSLLAMPFLHTLLLNDNRFTGKLMLPESSLPFQPPAAVNSPLVTLNVASNFLTGAISPSAAAVRNCHARGNCLAGGLEHCAYREDTRGQVDLLSGLGFAAWGADGQRSAEECARAARGEEGTAGAAVAGEASGDAGRSVQGHPVRPVRALREAVRCEAPAVSRDGRCVTAVKIHPDSALALWMLSETLNADAVFEGSAEGLCALAEGETEPKADWKGVVCDARGVPIAITLSGKGIMRPLSSLYPALASFDLVKLDLSHNLIYGPIMADLVALPNLQTLLLNGNYLVGTVPYESFSSSLLSIDISNNYLTGGIPPVIPVGSDPNALLACQGALNCFADAGACAVDAAAAGGSSQRSSAFCSSVCGGVNDYHSLCNGVADCLPPQVGFESQHVLPDPFTPKADPMCVCDTPREFVGGECVMPEEELMGGAAMAAADAAKAAAARAEE